jgi:large subunit ribosomal protein L1
MPAVVKRTKAWKEKLPPGKSYAIDEALKLVKEFATAKFNESVDVSVNLGVDATKSDQQVRGSTVMPHGTGKTVRVAVFTQGKNADAARAAGADIVGFEDLAEKVKAGQIDFDVVIASPDAMRIVGQLGQILGPRGLMPRARSRTPSPARCVTAPTRRESCTRRSGARALNRLRSRKTCWRWWRICRRSSRRPRREFI